MIELVQHVLYHAPQTVRGAERLLLLAIAEETREQGKPRDIPTLDLALALGVPERQVREVAERLQAKGIEVRVKIGTDRLGKAVYAKQGVVPKWLLPDLPVPSECACPVCRRLERHQTPPGAVDTAPGVYVQVKPGAVNTAPPEVGAVFPSGGAVNTAHSAVFPSGGAVNTAPTPSSVSVSVLLQDASIVSAVATRLRIEEEEAATVVERIKKKRSPRDLGGYIYKMPNPDLLRVLGEIRNPDTSQAEGDDIRAAWTVYHATVRHAERCEDGQPGGDVIRPDGRLGCRLCQLRAERRGEHLGAGPAEGASGQASTASAAGLSTAGGSEPEKLGQLIHLAPRRAAS